MRVNGGERGGGGGGGPGGEGGGAWSVVRTVKVWEGGWSFII